MLTNLFWKYIKFRRLPSEHRMRRKGVSFRVDYLPRCLQCCSFFSQFLPLFPHLAVSLHLSMCFLSYFHVSCVVLPSLTPLKDSLSLILSGPFLYLSPHTQFNNQKLGSAGCRAYNICLFKPELLCLILCSPLPSVILQISKLYFSYG